MKRATALVLAGSLAGASVAACVDLFHDTDSLFASADADVPSADGQAGDATTSPTALCTDSSATALQTAEAACAWLGACAAPFGVNEPGACMIEAVRAYDCGFDRSNAPLAERAAFWACMHTASTARSCDAVRRCVFPTQIRTCQANGDLFACLGPTQPFTRIFCRDSDGLEVEAPGAENCAAAGGGCVQRDAGDAVCGTVTDPPQSDGRTCTKSSCQGSTLSLCSADAGVEIAQLDCTLSGTGTCGSGTDAGPGCVAIKPTQKNGCFPDGAVECKGGVAQRCRNGALEEVHCASVGLGCDAEGAELTYQACRGPSSDAGSDAGTCTPACTAAGRSVRACMQGTIITLDCAAQGLGQCSKQSTKGIGGFACGAPSGADAN